MAWDDAYLDLMPHTVIINDLSGTNRYGEEVYSTQATTYQARVLRKPKLVRDFIGDEVVSHTTVWLASTGPAIEATAQVTLPDGSQPPLISVEEYPDEDGLHHQVLRF
jgi:hypothetical protein